MSWNRYESLRKKLLIVWGAWFPFMLALIVLAHAGLEVPPWAVMIIAVPWSAVTVVLSLRVSYWPCPRCDKPFFVRFALFPAGGKRCPHCGLRYLEEP